MQNVHMHNMYVYVGYCANYKFTERYVRFVYTYNLEIINLNQLSKLCNSYNCIVIVTYVQYLRSTDFTFLCIMFNVVLRDFM